MISALPLGIAAQAAAVLFVGPDRSSTTISDALAAANVGDTIRVDAGIYREHLVIDRRVVLLGAPGAVVDADHDGNVITVTAPATIRGLTLRGSGADLSREHAGIWAIHADGLQVEDNTLEDVLFGVYVKQSQRAVIRGNTVVGKDLPSPRRGDGVRLWYSNGGTIAHNTIDHVRDMVIWFSDSAYVHDNVVRNSRYGLHYMYSNHNRFENNEFLQNEVGAFLMYSKDIVFHHNVFAYARGPFGKGLGFKDADEISATDNLLAKNAVGIYLDNSPQSLGVINTFRQNLFAFNDVGVSLLPSVRNNHFVNNQFVGNIQPVSVTGGGDALGNQWDTNYWSEYSGFDENHDGRGDTPFFHERLSDDLLTRHEELKLYELSSATAVLDILGRFFPLLQPQPIVVDSAPRLRREPLTFSGTFTTEPRRSPMAPTLFGLLSLTCVAVARRVRRRAAVRP